MASSDAIIIGESWISEHYFGTDAKSQSFTSRVLERRKAWDETRAAGQATARSKFTDARASIESELAALSVDDGDNSADDDRTSEVRARLLSILGYTGGGIKLEHNGPVARVTMPGLSELASLVLIAAKPVANLEDLLEKQADTLASPFALDEATELTSVARALTALMVDEDGPQFALVLAGRWALVVERERWLEGRYLAINLQLVAERNDDKRGGEIDRALAALEAQSLLPAIDNGEIWWASILEESIKHTIGVSQDLRDGVRESIEIIANEVVQRRAAQNLEPLPSSEAQVLATQSLRFLYRILFLLYAEASPELGVLPVGASEYEQGYSLDRLRELVLVDLPSPRTQSGTHLYESLGRLFHFVDRGHTPPKQTADHAKRGNSGTADDADHGYGQSVLDDGLTFHSLRADLFAASATAQIDAVGLGNAAMQAVLERLLLSKQGGKDRGFISYAELGINQLGAVYEGLMSYTGFFAEEDLHEVAKGGNSDKGSWVVPVSRSAGIKPEDFVRDTTDEKRPIVHERGSFVYRLAGRERQQSASFYTPEVLTRFVVSQALEELLDQDGVVTLAADILHLTVCEPALGSGAFVIEATRQLAEEYLSRRQKELGTRIDPDDYQRRLQEVKAYIALHQVYGVDLNSTAVELAEISLWLDTMVEGLSAPWFGLHLKRGNSLIGARRAVFTRAQVEQKAHLAATPTDVPLTELADNLADERLAEATAGKIHHFLLPSEGWGATADATEAKELAPESLACIKAWRKSIRAKPTKKQLDQLVELGYRVEALWQLALRRMQLAEQQVRRDIPVWGSKNLPVGGQVSRERIEESLNDPNGAFQRLRYVMDAWTAMWFWPLTDHGVDGAVPPTLDEWINACQQILGRHRETGAVAQRQGQVAFSMVKTWDELGTAEEYDLGFASAQSLTDVARDHPWLRVTTMVAARQGFFHWELDFAAAFGRGGFDLQVGNPPWVRPRSDVDALLAEGDPWWQLTNKPSQAQIAEKRPETLAIPGMTALVVDGTTDVAAVASFIGSPSNYSSLTGLQPDLYRCFMEQTWRHGSATGITTLIHPESHFTDEKAGRLRSETYSRLRRHWQFINELQLYPEVHHLVSYGVHVYASLPTAVAFQMATSLYHPDTVRRSFEHDGDGAEPGLKDLDGKWDVRPHRNRIIHVDEAVLRTWHAVLEDESVPVRQTRMVYAVNRATAAVLDKLSAAPRIGQLGLEFSAGWHEKNDRTKGFFESRWGTPDSWDEVILQGPHLFVSTPMYKSPNSTMLHNQDWSATDFETLAPDAIPVTSYKPAGDRARYDAAYTHWGESRSDPARKHYRVAWRRMAANTGARTLVSAIIPPGAAHVHPVYSFTLPGESLRELARVQSYLSALVLDASVRSVPKSEILFGTINRMPLPKRTELDDFLITRTLRLHALTDAYAELWNSCANDIDAGTWAGGLDYPGRGRLENFDSTWDEDVPLRRASDRLQAQIEIDAIAALNLHISIDELSAIYRTQFPVLYGYDRREYLYDANGRLVPNSVASVWRKKGDSISQDERTATNQAGNTYVYELPFVNLDREADMRQAYAHFEQILEERS